MPKGANATVIAKMRQIETQPVYLYEACLGNGIYLRYASGVDGDITWNGYVWKAASVTHSPIECAQDTRIDETTITFPVIADELAAYLAAGVSLNGIQVNIYKVFRDALDDPLNYVHEFSGETDAPEYNETAMSVRVRRSYGTFSKTIPQLTYMPLCPWRFKGPQCGYTGSETTCDRTAARCQQLNNFNNYGGCLWIPLPAS